MELTDFDVIRKPVITDKAYQLNKDHNKVVFVVHKLATAPMVKRAAERLFNIKVKSVNVMNRKGKSKRVGKTRQFTTRPSLRKAILTLAEGYSLDFFGQVSGSAHVESNKQNDKD